MGCRRLRLSLLFRSVSTRQQLAEDSAYLCFSAACRAAMRKAPGSQSSKDTCRAEPTCNRMGSTFHKIGLPEKTWVSSLQSSGLPLLDVGACYGVQTIYALRSGRDVIAIDCCEQHITELRRRLKALHQEPKGNLVASIVATLPDRSVISEASVSGILCSEVVHFLRPEKLRSLFEHFFHWLTPGGKLVVTAAAWPSRIERLVEMGMVPAHGRSADDMRNILNNCQPSEVVDQAPGLMWLPKEAAASANLGDLLYLMSTVELKEFADFAGFDVEDVRYYEAQKRGITRPSSESETVLLLAKKPD